MIARWLNRPASARFVTLAVAVAWTAAFILWYADYRSFFAICDHDPGGALRADQLVAEGARPGVDFFYYYGFLPLLVARAFFAIAPRSPAGLLALAAIIAAVQGAGLRSILAALQPTRLGVLLFALALHHAPMPSAPTYMLEAALLIWVVALRLRGKTTAAVALAAAGTFVKVSMSTVFLAELVGLVALEAVRLRTMRPLKALVAAPVAFVAGALLCRLAFGPGVLSATMDPTAGAAVYKANDYGFLRQGLAIWWPGSHSMNYYLGDVMGPWLLGSIALLVAVVPSSLRLLTTAWHGAADAPDPRDEVRAMCAFANLAFIAVFFGPWIYMYSWLVIVGVTPWLARARLTEGTYAADASTATSAAWLAIGALLVTSAKAQLKSFVSFAREPRAQIGAVTMPLDEAADWNETLALGHSVGRGRVAVLGKFANFRMADPSLAEGRFWAMMKGMRPTPSDETELGAIRESDAILVTQFDYDDLTHIAEFGPVAARSERLRTGKYFLLLRTPH